MSVKVVYYMYQEVQVETMELVPTKRGHVKHGIAPLRYLTLVTHCTLKMAFTVHLRQLARQFPVWLQLILLVNLTINKN